MPYNITKTDNTTLITVNDTELNNDFGVTLVGRNYSGYGVFLNDNFVRLMENFANGSPPIRPIPGQLWFDTTTKTINIYNGNGFKQLAPMSVSVAEPDAAARAVGDLWWDLENLQLKAYTSSTFPHVATLAVGNTTEVRIDNTADLQIGDYITSAGGNITLATGSRVENIVSLTNVIITNPATLSSGETVTFFRGTGWNVVGPAWSIKQGVSGTIGKTIVDTNGFSHSVAVTYAKDQPVAIHSKDQEFTPRTTDRIPGWSTIKPGLSLRGSGVIQYQRTVTAYSSGSIDNTVIPVDSVTDLAVGDFIFSNNVSLGSGKTVTNIFTGNNSIRVDVNSIFAQDELIGFQRGTDVAFLLQGTATNSQALGGISPTRFARKDQDEIFASNIAIDGNLKVGNDTLYIENYPDGNVVIRTEGLGSGIAFKGNVVGLGDSTVLHIDNIDGEVSVRANPATALGIVPKQYSDAQLVQSSAWISANVAALIGATAPEDRRDFSNISALANTIITTANALATDVALKAYIESPTFTGVPAAPTAADSDNSAQIATTQYVTTAVTTLRNEQTVTNNAQDLQISLRATIESPVFEGSPRAPNPPDTNQSTRIATTRFTSNLVSILRTDLTAQIALRAPLASPVFTGNPQAPTPADTDADTSIATSALVDRRVNALKSYVDANATVQHNAILLRATIQSPVFTGLPRSVNPNDADASDRIATTLYTQNNLNALRAYTDSALNLKAPLVSPTLAGVPLAPNAVVGTNTAQIATTNFVQETANLKANISGVIFTGNVSAPTPFITDNSTQVATTNWVRNYVTNYASSRYWQGSGKFISTNTPDPNQGADGDFWFQYTP